MSCESQVALPYPIHEALREWMQNEMSAISEETISAGWECGLEYRLWRAIQLLPEPHEYYGTVISAARLERLKYISESLGEWAAWDDAVDEVVPISLVNWERRFAERNNTGPGSGLNAD